MSAVFDIVTVVISLFLLLRNVKNIKQGARYIIYCIFYFYYVFPLILDVLIAKPDYATNHMLAGFEVSCEDETTRCLYDAALIYSQLVILYFMNRKKIPARSEHPAFSGSGRHEWRNDSIFRWLIFAFAIFPILLALIFPINKSCLVLPMWRENEFFEMDKYYMLIERFVYMGVVCSVMLFAEALEKRKFLFVVIYAIFVYMDVCFQGKRSSLFFAFLVYTLASMSSLMKRNLNVRDLRRRVYSLILVLVVFLTTIIALSLYVKTTTRGVDSSETERLYVSLRVDMLRDDRVRLAIYSYMNPFVIKMLDYPGQSLWPIPTWIFPVDYALMIKYHVYYPSYCVFLSNALLMAGHAADDLVFATPSIFAELISNFGIIGALLTPFFFLWIAYVADKYIFPCNLFILVCFVVLQMYAISYMMYYIEFTVFICLYDKYKNRILRD